MFFLFLFRSIDLKVTGSDREQLRLSVCLYLVLDSGKIALERERLEAERRERERRFELESQERQVILDLLKEKVLKG